eukprot:scaffold5755_cov81-Isochrysis_galbana.AAC.1
MDSHQRCRKVPEGGTRPEPLRLGGGCGVGPPHPVFAPSQRAGAQPVGGGGGGAGPMAKNSRERRLLDQHMDS